MVGTNLLAGVTGMNHKSSVQMFIVYDHNPYEESLQTDWGFSCFVDGLEKFILFDTGANGQILLSNMEKLGIQPEDIDVVVLSHAHRGSYERAGGASRPQFQDRGLVASFFSQRF